MRSTYARVNMDFEARQLGAALKKLPGEIRKKIVRKGLREWGKRAMRAMRRAIPARDLEMKRDAAVKLKTYKRGRVFWAGVGIRKDQVRSGWRSHFWNNGFRVWQKGMRKDGTPKPAPKHPGRNPYPKIAWWARRSGWRKGIKKEGTRHTHGTITLHNPHKPPMGSARRRVRARRDRGGSAQCLGSPQP
jgi:hypothetical protein